ncbi:hypothetical protein IscW_ISCW012017 [Ixodes scapularis]|uniref:Uncharacterized protein n=1 Tax=Ixodes scapularis TaxID=6945 RepID=B7QE78_IXOSC|nr:hypothetical protein IscW_ISCW012017 [Ixodes scapularis]|eukprot:XP_002413842.1 hypothetical protein IscW_ISCW012017 [Ixodes scapularis]
MSPQMGTTSHPRKTRAYLFFLVLSGTPAAFPEAPPTRRARLSEAAQPVPIPTSDDDDEEENLLFRGYPASQDPAGRYRARVPDDSDHSSDSGETTPRRDHQYPPPNPARSCPDW